MKLKGLLISCLFCGLALGPGCRKEEPAFSLSWATSLVKVPFDRPFQPSLPDSAEISAAGGEYESFQVVIHGVTRPLAGARARVSSLKGKSGEIDPENVTLNPVGYVQTTVKPANYPGSTGWWPDPLLNLKEFDLAAGEVQPLWVTVYVPRGTAAGLYQGRVEVSAEGSGSCEIGFNLLVRGFDLPLRPSLKTLTWVNPLDSIYGCARGSDREREILKRCYDLLLKHRLGPGGSLELSDELLRYCMDRGMNCFLLEVIPNLNRQKQDSYPEAYKRRLTVKLAECVERFGPRGWLDGTAYVYNYDEVDREHWHLAKQMYSLVKKVSPQLRVIQCLNIPEGVEALAGYADTWDVYVAQFEQSGVQRQVARGDEAWLAVCCYPSVRPNLFLEYPAIDARILGWICRATGVSGFEYWSPNHWGPNRSCPGLRGGWTANTFLDYNGDGYLLYPGPDGEPVSSLRLANLRDGFEDYEYFGLLEGLKAVAAVPREVVASPVKYTSDPEVLYRARAKIAGEIEALTAAKEHALR